MSLNAPWSLFIRTEPTRFYPPSLRPGAPIGQALPVFLFCAASAFHSGRGDGGMRPACVRNEAPVHGTHLVRADMHPPPRQGRGRRRRSLPAVVGPTGRGITGDIVTFSHPDDRPLPRAKGKPPATARLSCHRAWTRHSSSTDRANTRSRRSSLTGVRTYRDANVARKRQAGRLRRRGRWRPHDPPRPDRPHAYEEKLADIGTVDIACVPIGGGTLAVRMPPRSSPSSTRRSSCP